MNSSAPKDILIKIERYCAYQERSCKEVETKLYELGAAKQEIGEIVKYLVENNFVDEQRFTRSFVRGKFFRKKWGKIKIELALRQKGIKSHMISKIIIEEIDDADYKKILNDLVQKKIDSLGKFDTKQTPKIIQYVKSKGYHIHDVLNIIQSL